jgi:hypothetical protein
MVPLLLTLLLSIGSPGPQQDDLRLTIARVQSADGPNNPAFTITLENRSDTDFMVVLGHMLANGKAMLPTAVKLVLTDATGRPRTLRYRDRRYAGIAGRVDDYVVPLRGRSSYVLRLSLAQFSSLEAGELEVKQPSGTYTLQATFEGSQVNPSTNSDMLGLRFMTFWAGRCHPTC